MVDVGNTNVGEATGVDVAMGGGVAVEVETDRVGGKSVVGVAVGVILAG